MGHMPITKIKGLHQKTMKNIKDIEFPSRRSTTKKTLHAKSDLTWAGKLCVNVLARWEKSLSGDLIRRNSHTVFRQTNRPLTSGEQAVLAFVQGTRGGV